MIGSHSGFGMPHLPDFEAWAIFAKVAEHGSFSGAANELALSKATVSKAVSRLEARLRTSLFHRTSRKLSLTESGRTALERAARILAEGQALEQEIAEGAAVPRGLVRLSAPMSFGIQHLGPALAAFLRAYPEVSVDLDLSDARTDIVAQGLDVALRIGQLDDSSLRARRLCAVRRLLVAAPSYLKAHGAPADPQELESRDVVVFSHLAAPNALVLHHPHRGEFTARISGSLAVNNADVVMPLLADGLVLALMPEFLVWREVKEGRLVEVLPDWSSELLALHVVTPPGNLRPARVTALIDFMAKHFVKAPWARDVPRLD